MSFCVRKTCPHGRGVFAFLADGPQRGDQSDPNWGRYPAEGESDDDWPMVDIDLPAADSPAWRAGDDGDEVGAR